MSSKQNKRLPKIIGITGGSCSGKTTLANRLVRLFGEHRATTICLDSYYRDQSHLTFAERELTNFDHPDSLEFDLLIRHIEALVLGEAIASPLYDFKTHQRLKETQQLIAKEIIFLDGTFILTHSELVKALYLSIYLEVPEKIRFSRRKDRDTKERGRTLESILTQFKNQVRPMHQRFVEPTKPLADYVVEEEHLDQLIKVLQELLKEENR